MNNRNTNGFSLIEMMVVLAIIVILTALAFPNFTKQIEQTRRTEATTALLEYALQFEEFYGTNYTYTGADTFYGLSSNPSTENNYYQLSSDIDEDGDGFTITATAQGTQAGDTSCLTLTIDNIGQKLPSTCWD